MVYVIGRGTDGDAGIVLEFADPDEASDDMAFRSTILRIGNDLQRVIYDNASNELFLWSTSGMFDALAEETVREALKLGPNFQFARIRNYDDFPL